MSRLLSWIKTHRLVTVLLVIVSYLLYKQYFYGSMVPFRSVLVAQNSRGYGEAALPSMGIASDSVGSTKRIVPPVLPQQAPPTETQDRLIVKDTDLSMVVKDVPQVVRDIEQIAETQGGYMVDSRVTIPEGASSGFITLRVPATKRGETLEAVKRLGVKVITENVSGTDVTDQYVDTDARLQTLTATKTKFEDILNSAEEVQDILQVQREIINLQQQIDSLKGQQKYLEQTAKLTRISIHLSTDELALPYAPDQPWRPEAIFKQAVRSLIGLVRQLGTAVIWIAVYSPVWLLALGLVWWLNRRAHTPSA